MTFSCGITGVLTDVSASKYAASVTGRLRLEGRESHVAKVSTVEESTNLGVYMEMSQVFLLVVNQVHIYVLKLTGFVCRYFDELVTMKGAENQYINILQFLKLRNVSQGEKSISWDIG